MGLTGLKSRCQQPAFLSGGSRGESLYWSFPASSGLCIPWLVDPLSIFRASEEGLNPFHTASLSPLFSLILPLLRAL